MINKLLVVKKSNLLLYISKSEFKDIFVNNRTNKKILIGKYLKGRIKDDSFLIKIANPFFNFSADPVQQFAFLFELIGYFAQNGNVLKIDLKLRIKKSILIFWLIGHVILAIIILIKSSLIVFSIIPLVGLINYIIMKVGISLVESFFINPFIEIFHDSQVPQ